METLDPKIAQFKERVVAEWAGDETASAWQKHYATMKEQLGPVTAALVEAADPHPGLNVLDLASGTGEPALSLARRVAPGGKVTATDLSEGMTMALRVNAEAEGVANIEARACDAHELPFPNATFDRVTARFGVMFFVEIAKALAEVRRVLKPGARAAFLVWGPPAPGTYFGAAVLPFMKRLAEKPDPDGPGPMRYAEPGKFSGLMMEAGFKDVSESILSLPAPFRGSPEEALATLMEIAAPFRNAAASLSPEDRKAAEEEVYENLRPLYDGTVIAITAPVIVVTGVN